MFVDKSVKVSIAGLVSAITAVSISTFATDSFAVFDGVKATPNCGISPDVGSMYSSYGEYV